MFAYEKGFSIGCVVPHTIQTGIGASPGMTSYDPDMADEETNDLDWKNDRRSVEVRFQGNSKTAGPLLMKLSPVELGCIWNR